MTDKTAGVLTITFNRPEKKNAITAEMYQLMVDAIADGENDPAVRAILFLGAGETFTAGNDLDDFLRAPPKAANSPVHQFMAQLSTAQKPVIAGVAGLAIGIGTTLLLHCDVVYAADNAKFSMPFVQLGLCPEFASSMLLPRVAGYQRAAEKLLFGESFTAAEAHAMGLVSKLVPSSELQAFATARACTLAALPASSLRVTKRLMKAEQQGQLQAALTEESKHFGAMLNAPEAREAFTAFFEKRKADFSKFN